MDNDNPNDANCNESNRSSNGSTLGRRIKIAAAIVPPLLGIATHQMLDEPHRQRLERMVRDLLAVQQECRPRPVEPDERGIKREHGLPQLSID